ncbi:glutathione S-transferase [Xylariaceae sp. FL0016]|nr:glutathione S-transferase [Xylariaceae sp. FL0016]
MAQEKPTLLHLNNSQSQTILWLLEELEIPYDLKLFERGTNGAPRSRAPPALKETHPLGKSPQLIVAPGGRVIAERSAIAAYLINKYDQAGKFKIAHMGADTDDAVREEELLAFGMSSFNVTAMTALLMHMLKTLSPFFVRPLVAAVAGMLSVGFLNKELAAQLKYMEGELAGRAFFMSEGDPTRVDVVMLFYVQMVAHTGIADMAPYPNVKGWMERCEARPAWKRALEKGNGERYAGIPLGAGAMSSFIFGFDIRRSMLVVKSSSLLFVLRLGIKWAAWLGMSS